MISRKFVEAIKLDGRPAYQIAHAVGIHPSTLSKLVCGIEKVKPGDVRVRAIGRVLGLTDSDLFDEGLGVAQAKRGVEQQEKKAHEN